MENTRCSRAQDVTNATREEVLALASRAQEQDGVAALSEQTLIDLRAAPEPERPASDEAAVVHLVCRNEGNVVGYGHLAWSGHRWSAEIVVDPDHRRRGFGSELLASLQELAGEDRIDVWAHGDLQQARAFAEVRGWSPSRVLLQMTRPVDDEHPVPPSAPPEGFTIRALTPEDDAELLRVNAAAFATHPEQGRMSARDVADRRASDWFEQDGVLGVFDEQARLAAFHWTKFEPGSDEGEVYVVGVDPAYQGRGLGRVATLIGLHHLIARGVQVISLYVEGDNIPALATYRKLGFTESARDVQYTPGPTPEA